MDVTRMTFADEAFDCVLDKATLDTMCQLDDEDEEEEEESSAKTEKHKNKKTHENKQNTGLSLARRACCASRAARFGRAGRTCA